MQLRATIYLAMVIFLLGMLVAYLGFGFEAFLWFGVGAGMATMNIYFAAWVVGHGLLSLKKKGFFLGLLMVKSVSFLSLVAVTLMFLKPLLLPFTLGLGVVIFASVGVALWESRRYLKLKTNSEA